jgi:hypothetical protein
MQRGRALRALALAALAALCALCALPSARASPSGSLVPVEQVYSSLLVAPVHYTVSGFIALDRFAPLKSAEVRQPSPPPLPPKKPFRSHKHASCLRARTLQLLTLARRARCVCARPLFWRAG